MKVTKSDGQRDRNVGVHKHGALNYVEVLHKISKISEPTGAKTRDQKLFLSPLRVHTVIRLLELPTHTQSNEDCFHPPKLSSGRPRP